MAAETAAAAAAPVAEVKDVDLTLSVLAALSNLLMEEPARRAAGQLTLVPLHGGKGESLVPPHTRWTRLSLSLSL